MIQFFDRNFFEICKKRINYPTPLLKNVAIQEGEKTMIYILGRSKEEAKEIAKKNGYKTETIKNFIPKDETGKPYTDDDEIVTLYYVEA